MQYGTVSASILGRQKFSWSSSSSRQRLGDSSGINLLPRAKYSRSHQLQQLAWSLSVCFPPISAWFTVACIRVGQLHSCWLNVPGLWQGAAQFTFRQPKDCYCSISEPKKGKASCLGQKPNQPSQTHATQSHENAGQGAFKNTRAKAKLFIPLVPHTPGLGLQGLKDTILMITAYSTITVRQFCMTLRQFLQQWNSLV